MTIVKSSPRKRPRKPAQAAAIKVPRIVQHTPRGKAWRLEALMAAPPDPEGEARAYAFMRRMGIKRPEEG